MKKKLLSGLFALALLATAGIGVVESKKNDIVLNDLALANVEALANGEEGNVGDVPCYGTTRSTPKEPDEYEPIWNVTNCNGCYPVHCFEFRDKSYCRSGGGGILVKS